MILVDANVLIYAYIEEFRQHAACKAWLDAHLSGRARIGLPWVSLLAFLRVVQNPRLSTAPPTSVQAWTQIESWLSAGPAWIPNPTERHAGVLASLVPAIAGPNHVPDAHLAALAIEHGLILATADRGFGRFPGLRWEDPLAS